MKYLVSSKVSFAILLLLSATTYQAFSKETLGKPPLCEASAAIYLACKESEKGCLLVGDNEQLTEVYLIPLLENGTPSDWMKRISLNLEISDNEGFSKKISDIEALASYAEDEILVFGSHSRNSKCEKKKSRRKFAKIRHPAIAGQENDRKSTKKISCKTLFGRGAHEDVLMNSVCATIQQVEDAADAIEDKYRNDGNEGEAKSACNEVRSYNAEGLLVVPDGSKSPSVWVGLRAPVLAQHPTQPDKTDLAILLHMPDVSEYKFDSVALLDLDGRGIRELALDGDTVWVIAGPSTDKDEEFQLRHFKLADLTKPEVIAPHSSMQTLPSSSEGLAIFETTGYVAIDGDSGGQENPKACEQPSRYVTISVFGS